MNAVKTYDVGVIVYSEDDYAEKPWSLIIRARNEHIARRQALEACYNHGYFASQFCHVEEVEQ